MTKGPGSLGSTPARGRLGGVSKALQWVKGSGVREENFQDCLIRGLLHCGTKSIGKAMTQLRDHKKYIMVDKIMKVGMFRQALCEEVVRPLSEYFTDMDVRSSWGTPSVTNIVKPKPFSKVLMEVTVRNVRRIVGELVRLNRLLSGCIMETDIVSDWGMFPLPRIVRQKACKCTPQAILIGHAKRESVRLLSHSVD